jgi:hypothetical protein
MGKVVVGLAVLAVPHAWSASPRIPVFLAHVLTFAAVGCVLQFMGRHDRRAVSLGLFFLVTSGAWADRLLEVVAGGTSLLAPLAEVGRHAQVAAFAPYFFWSFVRDFPRRRRVYRRERIVRYVMTGVLVLGAALAAANLALYVLAPQDALAAQLGRFGRSTPGSLFWPLIFVTLLPAMPFAVFQARTAALDERRRVRLVLGALVLGIAPEMALTLLSSVWPRLAVALATPEGLRLAGAVSYPAMLSIPVLTTYAVVAYQALDIRIIVRRVMQYALARSTIILVSALPLALTLAAVYAERDRRITELLSGRIGIVVLSGVALGAVALRAQPLLIAALDRTFFREQYDARVILGALVPRIHSLHDPAELARVLRMEIDSALHLRRVDVLLLDPEEGVYRPPDATLPRLATGARMVRQLGASVPLQVDWTRPAAWMAALPPWEREWLADTGIRLVVPVLSERGLPAGLIALGEKRSELPFLREDLLLLGTVAGAVALALDRDAARNAGRVRTDGTAPPAAQPASECPGCGMVAPPAAAECPGCGQQTRPAAAPLLIGDKFQLLRRIGAGGMGVVYRARDLALDREVAIKTLPRVTPEEAMRLRKEARAMAAVSHPNLAAIYGAEWWRGAPLLVVELLRGGTLADRLRDGPLSARATLELGIALAPAIERLHRAGVLHRDIKPSNIGFADDGTPKLLDFGVAHVLDTVAHSDARGTPWDSQDRKHPNAASLSRGELAGTIYYLSPEAVNGDRPDPRVDLWALALVLYECVAGRHPLLDTPWPAVLLRIVEGDFPDPREISGEVTESFARFFRDALHPDPRCRPATAHDLQSRLEAMLAGIPRVRDGEREAAFPIP